MLCKLNGLCYIKNDGKEATIPNDFRSVEAFRQKYEHTRIVYPPKEEFSNRSDPKGTMIIKIMFGKESIPYLPANGPAASAGKPMINPIKGGRA